MKDSNIMSKKKKIKEQDNKEPTQTEFDSVVRMLLKTPPEPKKKIAKTT
jgi:dynactin complex subunit